MSQQNLKIRENYVPKAKRLQAQLAQSKQQQEARRHQPYTLPSATPAPPVAPILSKQARLAQQKQISQLPGLLRKSITRQKCPLCGHLIDVNELENHLRIELLDPKWKLQKDREQDKKRGDSNLTLNVGSAVFDSLSKMSAMRPDIFGGDEEEAQRLLEESKKQAREKEMLSWDGHQESVQRVNQHVYRNANATDLTWAAMHEQRVAAQSVGPANPRDPLVHAINNSQIPLPSEAVVVDPTYGAVKTSSAYVNNNRK